MKYEELISELENYLSKLNQISIGFEDSYKKSGNYNYPGNHYELKQIVIEISDMIKDFLGKNEYSHNLFNAYNDGISNFFGTPSYNCIRDIISITDAALTRFKRNPEMLDRKEKANKNIKKDNIFIIHGHDEAKWRELKDILQNKFYLNPIILKDEVTGGSKTLIEKFETYADTCSCAIAMFTPDDVVEKDGQKYVQARPNVLFELGWFCGRLERKNVLFVLKEGTEIFSDFEGVVQLRFRKDINEIEDILKKELINIGLLE